jgi:hypothetical protein
MDFNFFILYTGRTPQSGAGSTELKPYYDTQVAP